MSIRSSLASHSAALRQLALAALCALGLFLCSFYTEVWQFYLSGILEGAGTCVILFLTMFIVAPRAGAYITGDSMIGEYFRVFVSYAVITVALIMYETNKRRARREAGQELVKEQEKEA